MPAPATPRILPHGPLEPLEDNLWRVEGSLARIPMRRVMTVARLGSGDLIIHNAITLDEPGMTKLESLGRPAYLVVPNGQHRLDAAAFAARYPQLRVLVPRGARAKISEVVRVDGTLDELPPDPAVTLSTVDGTRERDTLMIVRSGARTSLVFCDALFNMPHQHGLGGFVLRHLTGSTGGPKVSRLARLFMFVDLPAFADQLDRLATADVARVIVAHHETITDDPAGTLRRVAAAIRAR